MNTPSTPANSPAADLMDRWHALTEVRPGLLVRDAATQLGVSEAQLVAARCGNRVIRLIGPWSNLIQELPQLGRVMVLTRNEHVVHEKTGEFGAIQMFQQIGLVANKEIDLRIFLNHLHFGFAVTEAIADGDQQSLQFFDADGTAVHKIYLRGPSKRKAFDALVETYRNPNQDTEQLCRQALQPVAERPDSDIDQESLRRGWLALQDVHDFHDLLDRHGTRRVQALRLVGEDLARPVTLDAFQTALGMAADREVPIMVFVGNPGVIQIHTGTVHNLKRVGPWFNVLDDGFNLHLRENSVITAWAVRKPIAGGSVTSLEIYDDDNEQIALMFGAREPGEAEREDWRHLLSKISSAAEAVS